jgi:putative hydrolase of the HAD superfamily
VIPGLRLTKRPQALLLDAGDTLIFFDSAAVAGELAALGVSVDPAALDAALHDAKRAYQARLAVGHHHEDGWNVLVSELLVRAGITLDVARQHLPKLRRVHDDFYFWRKVPLDLIAALQRARVHGIRLAIVSNSEGRLRYVLDRLGLINYFELVIDSHLEGVQKPDPEIFRRALVRLGVPAERAVYAGDIPEVDVEGAERVGMHGVLIDGGDCYASLKGVARARSVAHLIDTLLALPE